MVYQIYYCHFSLEHFQDDCDTTFTQKYYGKFQFKWSAKDMSAKKKYVHERTS